MKLQLTLGAALLVAAFTTAAVAEHGEMKPKSYDSLGKCVTSALSKHDGKIVKLEMKSKQKIAVYEFDIESADGSLGYRV